MLEAEELLDECKGLIIKRGQQYGEAQTLYKRTATIWSEHLNAQISAADVCMMMALMKVSRIGEGVGDKAALKDSYMDAINYIALAFSLDGER
tara:strand:+ start:100 stop:378 length:279 start_codon:yes stop_codon:yes gene_type:complete